VVRPAQASIVVVQTPPAQPLAQPAPPPLPVPPLPSQPPSPAWYAPAQAAAARPVTARAGFVSATGTTAGAGIRTVEPACSINIATTAASNLTEDIRPQGCIGLHFDPTQSLNSDPYNLRSEELAVAECALGVEVRRTWSEKEMVRSFGGQIFPGTPDGVFESWDGELTCVQVVRVPIVAGMTPDQMQETLQQTVLVKVVKSQQWLRACLVVPHDFVIFCWLPFTIPGEVAKHTYDLIRRVQMLDPRFSLRLRVPAEPGALFPCRFAAHLSDGCSLERRCRSVSESDISPFTGTGLGSDSEDEDACPWDITWDWDCCDPSGDTAEGDNEASDEDDFEMEWDITWQWQTGCDSTPDEQSSKGSCASIQHQEGPLVLVHSPAGNVGVIVWDDGG